MRLGGLLKEMAGLGKEDTHESWVIFSEPHGYDDGGADMQAI